jgi:hypothetical protein
VAISSGVYSTRGIASPLSIQASSSSSSSLSLPRATRRLLSKFDRNFCQLLATLPIHRIFEAGMIRFQFAAGRQDFVGKHVQIGNLSRKPTSGCAKENQSRQWRARDAHAVNLHSDVFCSRMRTHVACFDKSSLNLSDTAPTPTTTTITQCNVTANNNNNDSKHQ